MKAAIIGAGFVGLELARQLKAAGHEAILLDVAKPVGLEDDAPFRFLDVQAERLELPPAVRAVFYLAQSPYFRDFPRQAGHLLAVNTLGPVKAAEAALAAGVRFFFYASTGNVYAPSFQPLAETDPAENDSAYAVSKLLAEKALGLFPPALGFCLGRLFGVFGPGQKNMLPARILGKVAAGEAVQLAPHPNLGLDGGLRVSFIFNPDLGRILVQLTEKALAGEPVPPLLNIGGPEPVALGQLAEEMGRCLKRVPSFEPGAEPRSFDLVADLTRLRQTLAPVFTPLAEAVRLTCGPATLVDNPR